ncbi:MAG: 3',5'-cyclic-nucleotide phosphodiesterase [Acidiferrobacterales bacterium]
MKIRVLGCSGGIGGLAATTSFLVDSDILIDAGTGVGSLSLDELAQIDHVFLTHSHLDHINSLPLMADSVGMVRHQPVNVYGRAETIDTLQQHILNGKVWPDFTVIPSVDTPFLKLHRLEPGSKTTIGNRHLVSVPVNHAVPAVGYVLGNHNGWLAFTGDTTETDEFWRVINGMDNLRYLFIETTFTNEHIELARIAKHLCPSMLASELQKLTQHPEVHLTHLMPGAEKTILAEIAELIPDGTPKPLTRDQLFEL